MGILRDVTVRVAGLTGVAFVLGCAQNPPAGPALSRIAYGSCAKQDKPQPIWNVIAAEQPDLFLFIGDTIYADTTDPDEIAACYARLAAIPQFEAFRREVPILAVWDDHDYGINDGGCEHPRKAEVQQVFLHFFEEPSDSPRWHREGLYDAWIYGPPGRRVQIIFLDTRYFRSPLKYIEVCGRRLYAANRDKGVTMLGEAQWRWLEAQLRQPAELRLLVSSIQVLPVDHPFEKWANLPRERQRLLDLLAQPHVNGLIILSGDQHLGEIMMLPREERPGRGGPMSRSAAVGDPRGEMSATPQQDTHGEESAPPRSVGDLRGKSSASPPLKHYPLFEMTASGMTHTRGMIPAPNSLRLGEYVLERHFGVVDIDWDQVDPEITLRIVTDRGATVLQHKLRLSELQ